MSAQDWLHNQGLRNCIIEVNERFFRLNSSLGIFEANTSDLDLYPKIVPPDWLFTLIQQEWY